MRTGDRSNVRFKFMYHPEYISVGSTLLFREGRTKGMGKITKIIYPEDKHAEKQKSKGRNGSKDNAKSDATEVAQKNGLRNSVKGESKTR